MSQALWIAKTGLDADGAREVLRTRSFRNEVDRDWQRSREMGLTGVPAFASDGRGVTGAQPYEVLEQLLVLARARKR